MPHRRARRLRDRRPHRDAAARARRLRRGDHGREGHPRREPAAGRLRQGAVGHLLLSPRSRSPGYSEDGGEGGRLRRRDVEAPVPRQQPGADHRGDRRSREGHRREAPRRKRRHASSACTWSARGSPSSSAQGYLAVNWEATVDEVARVHPAAPDAVRALRRERARAHRKEPARLMADVTMPQLGETVTEGTITKWFKKVGDAVTVDEPLFEVSTDKVDTEVPSPDRRVHRRDQGQRGRHRRRRRGDRGHLVRCRRAAGDARAARRRACTGPARSAAAAADAPPPPPAAAHLRRHLQLPRPRRRRPQPRSGTGGRRPATSCSRRWCAASSPSTASIPPRSRAPAPVVASPAKTCSITSTSTSATAAWRRHLPAPRCSAGGTRGTRSCACARGRRPAAVAPAAAPGQREEVVTLPKIRKLTGDHMVMSLATVTARVQRRRGRLRERRPGAPRAHGRVAGARGVHPHVPAVRQRGRSSMRSPSSRT